MLPWRPRRSPTSLTQGIWETDDDTLDYAVDVVLGDVNDDYIGDVTMEMVKAADWE